jgi:hypothetical protein
MAASFRQCAPGGSTIRFDERKTTMKMRELGHSGLHVSALGLGCMGIDFLGIATSSAKTMA